LEKKTGVYVFEVLADQPLSNNEILVGDIIVEFNRHPIASVDDLHKQLDEKSMGQKMQMGVLRKGRKVLIEVIPGEMK
ncbi:MAG TPA: PDZ domain-containing protein, partial [Puia sp.]|nr:PDZ domain-containing protein [Puia sp.]